MLIIRPDGCLVKAPTKGITLSKLQNLVNGYIEIIRLPNRKIAIVNEDGIGLGLPVNPIASQTIGTPIVGVCVIMAASALP